MHGRILHVLSQRPSRTGSGVTLDALVRLAASAGWRQAAVVGVPAGESSPQVGELPHGAVHRVTFADVDHPALDTDLPFPVPGMSDVMPYPSSVWSRLDSAQLDAYRRKWHERLSALVGAFVPDLIHTNHIWLVSSLLKDIAPRTPVVVTCHATGLRQMELCPGLREYVVAGCRRLDRICVLHDEHRTRLTDILGIPGDRLTTIGAGYRDDLFRPSRRDEADADTLLYVGKLSSAKGLPWLLDAVVRLAAHRPGLRLHIAGGGAGQAADELRRRCTALAPLVMLHGALAQPALAALMRRCQVCVLPSFYEGLPLVLVEAAACGCQLVATDLTGVREQIAPAVGERLSLVPLPRLTGVDTPHTADLPAFTTALTDALEQSLIRAAQETPPADLVDFTWQAVFRRVEAVWRELLV